MIRFIAMTCIAVGLSACVTKPSREQILTDDEDFLLTRDLRADSELWLDFQKALAYRDIIAMVATFESSDDAAACESLDITVVVAEDVIRTFRLPSTAQACDESRASGKASGESSKSPPYSGLLIMPNTKNWYLWRSLRRDGGMLNVTGPLQIGVTCSANCSFSIENSNGDVMKRFHLRK